METLAKALAYSLLIVAVAGVVVYLLHGVYRFFRYLDERYPRIWLFLGAALVLLALLLDALRSTVFALLAATAGLLLGAIGGVLWWLDRRDGTPRGDGSRPSAES